VVVGNVVVVVVGVEVVVVAGVGVVVVGVICSVELNQTSNEHTPVKDSNIIMINIFFVIDAFYQPGHVSGLQDCISVSSPVQGLPPFSSCIFLDRLRDFSPVPHV
jgi:hypothetical protein